MANGHGGPRRNSGAPYASPRAAALRILEAAVAYCAGIAGDPRRQLPIEETWARYLDQVGVAGQLAAASDLPDAVKTSFTMLDRSVSVRIAEDSGDGLSALLRALDHGSAVPQPSRLGAEDEQGRLGVDPEGVGAPEPLSGGLPGHSPVPRLGIEQLGLFGASARAEELGGPAAGEGEPGPRGAPRPPSQAPPISFGVDPQNLDFSPDEGGSA